MALVEYSAGLPCSADQAWKVLRDFGGIADWHPAIVKSGIEGGAGVLGGVRSGGWSLRTARCCGSV
ncbi:SRPBCC family protein [Pseudomonas graminis]|uniref:SRPBCC family protein n=1 Tax=Pseudomonas graminis TaxID=158627 RepID=UPI0010604325